MLTLAVESLLDRPLAATRLLLCPTVMAAVCDICGVSPQFGNNISHSHRRTRRRWDPNVQKMRVLINGVPRHAHVCTKCLKANKVIKAV
jgi:large subunit ribosomal protein L28